MIRVGLVGFGLAGQVFHGPLVAAEPRLELTSIVTASPQRQAAARAAYPGAEVIASVEELWGAIDVLVVAAPNDAHAALAAAALDRGLAVVVDKPLAPDAAAGAELLQRGGRLTVFQNRRWDGDFLTAQALVNAGTLGPVTRLESRFERFAPEVRVGTWRETAGAAGGVLLDLGAHLVDQAVFLLGPAHRVYAELDARRPGAQVEDDAFVALEHARGARSHLWLSAIAPLAGPRLRLSGLRAGFACDGLDPQEDQLGRGLRPGDTGWGERPPGWIVDADGAHEAPLLAGRWEAFYAGVAAWLLDGAPPPVDPRDSLRVMELLEAARRSAREHDVVDMTETRLVG